MPVAKYQLIRVKVKPANPNSIPYLRSVDAIEILYHPHHLMLPLKREN